MKIPSSSVDTPSLVHRFDVVSMENRWTGDGVATKKKETIGEGI